MKSNVKLTLDEFKEIARDRGGKCLSNEYINVDTKLQWECKEGHMWWAKASHIKYRNQWCPACANNKKIGRTGWNKGLRRFNFDKKKLEELYFDKEYTIKDIAKLYNCSSTTVATAFKEHCIKNKSLSEIKTKYIIEKDTLQKYCDDDMSLREISQKFNCSEGVISNNIKKYGIIRDTSSDSYRKRRYKERIVIESELLWSLYWGNQYTIRQIANICKCYDSTIMNKFKKHNIPTLSISESLILHESHRGSKNWSWDGGKAVLNEGMRKSREYKQWRLLVKKRDNWACQICGETKENDIEIHAHHIKSFADYPELMFDVDNGICLCGSCHMWIHHLNPLDFQ